MNGDANADAVLTSSGGHVTVMLGTGLGVFFAPVTYDMAGAEGATPADLDGNGRDDLVVPFNTSGPSGVGLSIWAPDPSGAIATPKLFSLVNLSGPTDVAIGDVNGDGHLDAVTVTNFGFPPFLSGDLEVLLGTPSGLFAAPVQANIAPHFRVCLADLTLDGKLDAITVLFTLTTLEVLTGNGAGILARDDGARSDASFGVGAGDLNADGLPDVFTSDGSGNTVTLYFGNGAGGFLGTTALATGGFPLEANAGDLNGDGVLDLVSANNAASGISVLLGLGAGRSPRRSPTSAARAPTACASTTSTATETSTWPSPRRRTSSSYSWETASGAFTGPSTYGFPSQSLVRAVTVCDVDGDGRRDIVAGTLATRPWASCEASAAGTSRLPISILPAAPSDLA